MRSTGNDIVALTLTDSDRTSRYRFYSRILSPAELPLYDGLHGGLPLSVDRRGCTGLSFSSFVWVMWSIKESAYKYVSRSDRSLVFAPLKIPVSALRIREDQYEGVIPYSYEGLIRYGGLTLYSRSFLSDEAIMTVVSEGKDFSDSRWGLEVIGDQEYEGQSALVRTFALQSLSTVLPGAALRIVKTPDGPPEVWDGPILLNIPLSLAHHGRYVAWCYRLPANNSSYRNSAAN